MTNKYLEKVAEIELRKEASAGALGGLAKHLKKTTMKGLQGPGTRQGGVIAASKKRHATGKGFQFAPGM